MGETIKNALNGAAPVIIAAIMFAVVAMVWLSGLHQWFRKHVSYGHLFLAGIITIIIIPAVLLALNSTGILTIWK